MECVVPRGTKQLPGERGTDQAAQQVVQALQVIASAGSRSNALLLRQCGAEQPEVHLRVWTLLRRGKPWVGGADQLKAASIQGCDTLAANDRRKSAIDGLPRRDDGIGDAGGVDSLGGEPLESTGNLATVMG